MLIENRQYEDEKTLSKDLEGTVLRYCSIKDISIDGGNVDATFIGCEFQNLDWYWGLFNTSLFADVTFKNCIFRGTAFSGCRFIDCSFVGCRFMKDNLDSPCTFDDSKWFDCKVEHCEGLPSDAFFNSSLDTDAKARQLARR